MKRHILAVVFVLVSGLSAFGQSRIAGRVVEILDGRTMVLETNSGRMRVQIAYIETPESEQATYAIVKDHLTKMLAGTVVEFRPIRIGDTNSMGTIDLRGVDVGMQLIRDGAAWHEPLETSGQPRAEAAEYAKVQSLAKSEKRGIWSVAGLKAPWELRAEREAELERQAALKRGNRTVAAGINQYQTIVRPGVKKAADVDHSKAGASNWDFLFTEGGNEEGYGVRVYKDPNGRYRAVYTSPVFIDLQGGGSKYRLECRVVHYTSSFGESWYAIYFRSFSDEYRFEGRRNQLSFIADKRNLPVGRPYVGVKSRAMHGNHELFFYRTGRANLSAISNGTDLVLRIDALSGKASAELRGLIKDLVAGTK